MALSVILLGAGIAGALLGGDLLVRGSLRLARQLRLPPLFVGLTVVALGTSAPELAVNVTAALEEHTEVSFGNVVGSNIANLAFVLALASMAKPISGRRAATRFEWRFLVWITAASVLLVSEFWLFGKPAAYGRADGLVLLFLCALFFILSLRRNRADGAWRSSAPRADQEVKRKTATAAVGVGIGLVALIAGAEITIRSASSLSEHFGISEAVVALTLVAIGTSLPELVATAMAARRGAGDLALGNVLGSNILNLTLIKGVTAVVHPIPLPAWGLLDLGFMAVVTLAVYLVLHARERLGRREGALLIVSYAVFLLLRILL